MKQTSTHGVAPCDEGNNDPGTRIDRWAGPHGVAIPSTTDMQLRLVDAKNALQHAADAASPEVAGVYRQRAAELAEIVSVLAHGVALPLKTWQHDETGRIAETGECPGPRWTEVPAGVEGTPK